MPQSFWHLGEKVTTKNDDCSIGHCFCLTADICVTWFVRSTMQYGSYDPDAARSCSYQVGSLQLPHYSPVSTVVFPLSQYSPASTGVSPISTAVYPSGNWGVSNLHDSPASTEVCPICTVFPIVDLSYAVFGVCQLVADVQYTPGRLACRWPTNAVSE